MSELFQTVSHSVVVEAQVEFTLIELSRACAGDAEQIKILVAEGVLEPRGPGPELWRFDGAELARARTALRLMRDLELNPPGVALVLELLSEIDTLKAKIQSQARR